MLKGLCLILGDYQLRGSMHAPMDYIGGGGGPIGTLPNDYIGGGGGPIGTLPNDYISGGSWNTP